MRTTWIASEQIISPLGATDHANYAALRLGRTGIALHENSIYSEKPVYLSGIPASVVPVDSTIPESATRFEKLVLLSILDALKKINLNPGSSKVIFILSTTKGNIDLLEQGKSNHPHIHLGPTAKSIAEFFGNGNTPVVVSNACVSGVTAMLIGKHLLDSGQYDHAIVTGADLLSRFVVSGFQCLSALSNEPCRPFDKDRKGTTLGEAVGTLILTAEPSAVGADPVVKILGGGLSNDANHISGPSRTGEELYMAIDRAIVQSRIHKEDIDFVSAHGTATLFNDEMEAKAFGMAKLSGVPTNSLKGYFGHTLGAAGIVESVISIHSLRHNELIPTLGYAHEGVSVPMNITATVESKSLTTCLKTASGFGGCNAAVILQKVV